ncbi:MAG: DUF4935 domain-containing protein [Kiritimatiellae bacterium]|nr:DUF4935 domain-containing protein [Kiritimatiellia bacterium]
MKNLFIDSNIWLSLYHFSNNDLEQFGKLKNHLGENIKLLLPQQVVNEVFRNRDVKIRDALSFFKDWKKPQFPNFCKGYEECAKFTKGLDILEQYRKRWLSKILEDTRKQNLPADKVIQTLFNFVSPIECTAQMIHAAEYRYKIGNPPGKDNKLGDAINWECLLATTPQNEDLYIITADSDYQSAVDKNSFNLFLRLEWEGRKQSEIHYYPDLVSFFSAHAKDIKLQDERNKNDLIRSLKSSPSYATTHALVAQLQQYSDWTTEQINSMCEAAIHNSQINDIFSDSDILNFYKHMLSSTTADTENIQIVRSMLSPQKYLGNV